MTFAAEGSRTRVEVVHGGWGALGEDADEARGSYGGADGWPSVLGCFERFLNN